MIQEQIYYVPSDEEEGVYDVPMEEEDDESSDEIEISRPSTVKSTPTTERKNVTLEEIEEGESGSLYQDWLQHQRATDDAASDKTNAGDTLSPPESTKKHANRITQISTLESICKHVCQQFAETVKNLEKDCANECERLRRDQILRVSCGFSWDDWNNIFEVRCWSGVSPLSYFVLFSPRRVLARQSKTDLRTLIKHLHPDKQESTGNSDVSSLHKLLLTKVLSAYKQQ